MSLEPKNRVSQVIGSIRKLTDAQMWPEAASLASTERARNPKEIFLMALDNRFRSLMEHRLSTTENNEEMKALFQRDVLVIQQLCAMALRDAERKFEPIQEKSAHTKDPTASAKQSAEPQTVLGEQTQVLQNMHDIRQTVLAYIRQQNYCGAFELLFSLLAADPLNETLFGLYEAVQASARHNYKASHFLSAIAHLHAEKRHRAALQILDEALMFDPLNERYHELRAMLEQGHSSLAQQQMATQAEIPHQRSSGTQTAQAH
ncbi:MAG TPA: hypothetical protein VMU30_09840 [Bacteroidota bacterium]|nr:hypothetical protein [Bacteroidota bacterium]